MTREEFLHLLSLSPDSETHQTEYLLDRDDGTWHVAIDRPLTAEEVAFVSEALAAEIEQVRIPHVFPLPDRKRGLADGVSSDAAAIASNLVKTGIRGDGGTQVALVVPRNSHQHLVLMEAILTATGFHPYIIQTAEQREHVGNPGDLRVLDTHGLMGLK